VILIASVAGSKKFIGYAEMAERIVTDEAAYVTIGEGETEMTTTKPFRIVWKKMYVSFLSFFIWLGLVLEYYFILTSSYSNLGSCPGLPFAKTEQIIDGDTPVHLFQNCQVIN
jgi:hypothetical protein